MLTLKVLKKLPSKEINYFYYFCLRPDSYPEWVRRRSIDIEEDTGLYNNSLQLLTISMGNGFNVRILEGLFNSLLL